MDTTQNKKTTDWNQKVRRKVKMPYIHVTLTKEEKTKIRNRWNNTFIVKVFGKTVVYQHLVYKLNQLRKPQGDGFQTSELLKPLSP
ncbi:hypothetical protein REPUB_Repub11eG0088800 [Reevesia pubescens]